MILKHFVSVSRLCTLWILYSSNCGEKKTDKINQNSPESTCNLLIDEGDLLGLDTFEQLSRENMGNIINKILIAVY